MTDSTIKRFSGSYSFVSYFNSVGKIIWILIALFFCRLIFISSDKSFFVNLAFSLLILAIVLFIPRINKLLEITINKDRVAVNDDVQENFLDQFKFQKELPIKKEYLDDEQKFLLENDQNYYVFKAGLFNEFSPGKYNYFFNKNNIKKVHITKTFDELKNKSKHEVYYATDLNKLVKIEFIKPLNQKMVLNSKKVDGFYPPLNELYLSVKNPEEFVRELKKISQ